MNVAATALHSVRRQHRWVTRASIIGSQLLRDNIVRQIDSRIAGKTLATNGPLFDTITHNDAGPFTRNADFWGADIVSAFTCFSPSNETEDGQRGGTLLTAQHILLATHHTITTGHSVRFVTAGDVAVARDVIGQAAITGTDLTIATLSSALPATITPAKVPPDNLLTFLRMAGSPTIPSVSLDQEEKGLIRDIRDINVSSAAAISMVRQYQSAISARSEFYEANVAGDSGKAVFVIVGSQIMVLGVILGNDTEGHALANSIVGRVTDLNAAIAAADADGSVTTNLTVTPMGMTDADIL